jgi:hypothetical protein
MQINPFDVLPETVHINPGTYITEDTLK